MYQQPNNGHGQGAPSHRGGFNQATQMYGQQYPPQQPGMSQQYGQPGYQGGFQQGGPPHRGPHSSNTYPPPKRQKGNPVITRYAPPPGYQAPPPGQPWHGGGQFKGTQQGFQPPFQQQPPSFQRPSGPPNFQNAWQPQHGQYGGGAMTQSPQTYAGTSHNFPTAQQQQATQTYPQHYSQQPQHSNSSNQGRFPPAQGHHSQPVPQRQQSTWSNPSSAQNGFSSRQEGFGGSPNYGSPPRAGPGAHSGRDSVGSMKSMAPPPFSGLNQEQTTESVDMGTAGDQATAGAEPDPNDPLNMKEHDWTFDPEGAIWPKATEVVDSSLSLGLIAWHPGARMTRALPSTFAAAEQFTRAAMPAVVGLGDSVSTYFMIENHENAYENISSLAHWVRIKNDPVFVSFPEEYESLPVSEVKEWRNRADVIHENVSDLEEEGEIGLDAGELSGVAQMPTNPQHQQIHHQGPPRPDQVETQRGHRTEDTTESGLDQSQESILASLGVEGPARPVYPTPGPAYGGQSAGRPSASLNGAGPPHDTQAHGIQSGGVGERGTSLPDDQKTYPPADDPIEQAIARAIAGNRSPSQSTAPSADAKAGVPSQPEPYDPWNPDQGMPVAQVPSPTTSNKTHSGSDFAQDTTQDAIRNGHDGPPPPEKMDEDERPPLLGQENSVSRKRSYDNFNDRDNSDEEHKRRQSNDGSSVRRPSKTKTPSDDAYSRRW